jgi:hypothetical protein
MKCLRRTYYIPFVATTLPLRTHYVQRVFATLLGYQSHKRDVISLYMLVLMIINFKWQYKAWRMTCYEVNVSRY